MIVTLRHIRIFLAVCKYNNVTMAAKELFIAQPAASLAIKELEEYYGIKLLAGRTQPGIWLVYQTIHSGPDLQRRKVNRKNRQLSDGRQ